MPDHLFDVVMLRIKKEEQRRALRTCGGISLLLIFSSIACVSAAYAVFLEMMASGFIGVASIVFLDFGEVFSMWKTVVFALLESFPSVDMCILMIALFAFLQFLKFYIKNIEDIKQSMNIPKYISMI